MNITKIVSENYTEKVDEKNTDSDKKNIHIIGINNRYQIKKLTNKDDNKIKLRKESQKWKLPEEVYDRNYQLTLLKKIHLRKDGETSEDETVRLNKLLIQQVERKLSNYKQQDLLKNIYDSNNIISLGKTIAMLNESNLLCCYCKKEMLILYEVVRESYQWTLDRIDNSLGHNNDNVIISCLQCNLKRRKQSKDAFLFTKQLQIVKKG
jgi:hypothetical protein